MDSERNLSSSSTAHLAETFQALPVRERSLLRLVHLRGASQREIAGALGITRTALRVMLRRAERKARDPTQAALVRTWRRLTARERRLAYLHLVLGLSLGEIARRRLAPARAMGARVSARARTRWRGV